MVNSNSLTKKTSPILVESRLPTPDYWKGPHPNFGGWAIFFNGYNIWLVVEPPLWNIWKSVGMIIHILWKKCLKPPAQTCYNHDPTVSFW